jgi:hypothetical protein
MHVGRQSERPGAKRVSVRDSKKKKNTQERGNEHQEGQLRVLASGDVGARGSS